MIENYEILLGKGLNLPRGFANSLFLAVASTAVSVYFSLLTAYGVGRLRLSGQKTILQLYHRVGHDPHAAFHYWFLSIHVKVGVDR